jgi:hypothetical protein
MFLVQRDELRINHLTPLLVVTMPYACSDHTPPTCFLINKTLIQSWRFKSAAYVLELRLRPNILSWVKLTHRWLWFRFFYHFILYLKQVLNPKAYPQCGSHHLCTSNTSHMTNRALKCRITSVIVVICKFTLESLVDEKCVEQSRCRIIKLRLYNVIMFNL